MNSEGFHRSPYSGGGTPRRDSYYESRTTTASPHYAQGPYTPVTPQQRPATRAGHTRSSSSAAQYPQRPPSASPRYTSSGEYATAGINGRSYYAPAAGDYLHRDPAYDRATPRPAPHKSTPQKSASRKPSSARRSSTSASASQQNKDFWEQFNPRTKKREATDEDRKKWGVPRGYSMKNWDPSETPILLLGSVFDANSLGKWIYDWTANVHGPATPLADMAGELWLLLIQLYGKIARMEKVVGRVRRDDAKETVDEFLAGGDRLGHKLQAMLKRCEQPMLDVGKSGAGGASSLGSSSGVEFVKTLFGRDRELERVERFMASVKTFNWRFDVNCDFIVRNPTK